LTIKMPPFWKVSRHPVSTQMRLSRHPVSTMQNTLYARMGRWLRPFFSGSIPLILYSDFRAMLSYHFFKIQINPLWPVYPFIGDWNTVWRYDWFNFVTNYCGLFKPTSYISVWEFCIIAKITSLETTIWY
jgi:hypothetical protein